MRKSMGNSAQMKVDIEVMESMLQPENREISPEYILKHSTTRGSNIFQLFDITEKPKHFVASRRRWLNSQWKNRVFWSNSDIPAVPREDLENATAAAQLAFIQGGRRPLGPDGRQAKARFCFREIGSGSAEIPGEK